MFVLTCDAADLRCLLAATVDLLLEEFRVSPTRGELEPEKNRFFISNIFCFGINVVRGPLFNDNRVN